ncbi:hypothetical protein M758_12G088800 [Ceratodon purpureus]|nr:hypothetical protein M758_12G088800 [Ceratodon purpureus]
MFHNQSLKVVLAYWTSCDSCVGVKTPHTSLRNLMDKNIIKQGYEGQLEVHDLLIDLGQQLGGEARSHLVCDGMNDGILFAYHGVEETVALNLARSRKRKFDAKYFTNVPNLHYLRLPDGCKMYGDLKCISKQLRWLQWRKMPYQNVPKELNLIHLLSLDFSQSTKLASLWVESNDSLKGCPNLRSLFLSDCTSITKLPDSIGQLSQLQLLYLNGCTNLEKLPESIGQLKALESLVLSCCISLKAIPNSLGLSSLTWLSAWGCQSLVKLPTSVGQSSQLRCLSLRGCRSLEKLPKSIGQLQALEHLFLNGCTSLKALPDSIGALSNLQTLEARNCSSLVKVPYSPIALLPCLRNLSIVPGRECQVFFDGEVGAAWTQLRWLTLRNCGGLRSLVDYGALKSLVELDLSDRTLTELPESLGLLVGLKRLQIFDCERLQIDCLPKSFVGLRLLERLILDNCENLRRLPKDLAVLTSLKRLYIYNCPIRRVPRSISRLSRLEALHLTECKNLQKLATSIRQLERLREFTLTSCGSIEAMGALTTLQGLPIWGSTSLTKLPASLGMVSDLDIRGDHAINPYEYDVSSYRVLEEDESGFLRAYRVKWSELTTLVRRSHKKQERSAVPTCQGLIPNHDPSTLIQST